MYYSKSTGGFYSLDIHGNNIPPEAVEITTEDHSALMLAQSEGKQIVADDNGNPIAINPPMPIRTNVVLLADVAAKRWHVETDGIIVADVPIKTDRGSQAQLNSAYTSLKSGLIADTPWKAADGSFTLVTLAELEPVAKAVAEHISSCFAAERAHTEAINLLQTQVELDAYDIDTGWPSANY
ncbi:DUF4376 domain-containing protein [Aeromonas caviae]|nr:DUF4376 domain-containing protein [Aeromonas caviae]MDH0435560.1 DUF4376 domain-containing protein [Aeromonas caviae]MDH0938405.1 DUF4376 domain-containing protein [Aeromonas caviae]MDH1399238.1 DUF4376 domain-containing protein [Aeromonas caviae]